MNWGGESRRYPDFYERRAGNPRYRRRHEQAELTAKVLPLQRTLVERELNRVFQSHGSAVSCWRLTWRKRR